MRVDSSIDGALFALRQALGLSRHQAEGVSRAGSAPVHSLREKDESTPSTERPAFTVNISAESRSRQAAAEKRVSDIPAAAGPEEDRAERAEGGEPREPNPIDERASGPGAQELSSEERAEIAKLQGRDTEVRAHEAAHTSAGGALASTPSFTYQTGPDGGQYAVGGEVSIQVRRGSTPEETLRIASQVRAAALAPARPSSADVSVAASASTLESQARQEIAEARTAELRGDSAESGTSPKPLDWQAPPEDENPLLQQENNLLPIDSFDPRVRHYADPAFAHSTTVDLFG